MPRTPRTVWELPRNDVAACLAFVRARRGRVTDDELHVMQMLQDDWTELREQLRRRETTLRRRRRRGRPRGLGTRPR